MTEHTFRSTASFGKRQEYIAVAELLKRGLDVYMTLVDDQQIDCVVRIPGKPPRYVDLQIKARSKNAKNAATFAGRRRIPYHTRGAGSFGTFGTARSP